ncbi:MAG: HDOD domain-containing protein [Mariprofundaceae bacterium]|nr:HDOD domain-containing protein [Mariprofundaceae bacterium]
MSVDVGKIAEEIRVRFRAGEAKLPLLPEAVIQVRRIVQDESQGAADIARALGNDMTFSATVLRIANSARFKSGSFEIRSLPMAIQRLGGRRTLQLMVAISAKIHMQVKNKALQKILQQTSAHSLSVAVAAQHLATLIQSAEPEEAFLAGMLHDIGVQAVVCAVPDLLIPLEHADKLKVIQRLHREMGGRLLNHWDMPDVFETIASHHGIESDDRPRDKLIDFIDAADFLVQHNGVKVLFDAIGDVDIQHYPPIQRLGATEVHLAAVEIELETSIGDMQATIG